MYNTYRYTQMESCCIVSRCKVHTFALLFLLRRSLTFPGRLILFHFLRFSSMRRVVRVNLEKLKILCARNDLVDRKLCEKTFDHIFPYEFPSLFLNTQSAAYFQLKFQLLFNDFLSITQLTLGFIFMLVRTEHNVSTQLIEEKKQKTSEDLKLFLNHICNFDVLIPFEKIASASVIRTSLMPLFIDYYCSFLTIYVENLP